MIEYPEIKLHCDMRANSIKESADSVSITFEDGTTAIGDILLGCDGVHSFTRSHHVEPSRKQIYSGVSNAFGYAPIGKDEKLHFDVSALNFARRGLMLTTLHESSRTSGYVGALVSVADVGSRDGWKAKGSDVTALKADMMERFGDSTHPCIQSFIQNGEGWFLWPVYMLSHGGRWATNRTMLLGDAAHAMPPQGESTSVLLESTVIFARCLVKTQLNGGSVKDGFDAFEKLRRPRIDAAFKESQNVVSQIKDSGPIAFTLKIWLIPIVFSLTRSARMKHFEADAAIMPLESEKVTPTPTSITLPERGLHYRLLNMLSTFWSHIQVAWRTKQPAKYKAL
jgi:salicylate hydroxylase